MKGWVGWPVADGLPTLVVTHQLQVELRTRKVRQSETGVLPRCYGTNPSQVDRGFEVCYWQTTTSVECGCPSGQRHKEVWRSYYTFLQAGCPSCHPTNSVEALKALHTRCMWVQKSKIESSVHYTPEPACVQPSACSQHITSTKLNSSLRTAALESTCQELNKK